MRFTLGVKKAVLQQRPLEAMNTLISLAEWNNKQVLSEIGSVSQLSEASLAIKRLPRLRTTGWCWVRSYEWIGMHVKKGAHLWFQNLLQLCLRKITLLQQTVGEELGGVGDNEAFSSSGKLEFICRAASLSVTINVDCEPVGENVICDANRRLTVADEKWRVSCAHGR